MTTTLGLIVMCTAMGVTTSEPSFADTLSQMTGAAHTAHSSSVRKHIERHVKKELSHFEQSCAEMSRRGHNYVVWRGNGIDIGETTSSIGFESLDHVNIEGMVKAQKEKERVKAQTDHVLPPHRRPLPRLISVVPPDFGLSLCKNPEQRWFEPVNGGDIMFNHFELLPLKKIFNPYLGGNVYTSRSNAADGLINEFRRQVASMGFRNVLVFCIPYVKCSNGGSTSTPDTCPHVIIRVEWSVTSPSQNTAKRSVPFQYPIEL